MPLSAPFIRPNLTIAVVLATSALTCLAPSASAIEPMIVGNAATCGDGRLAPVEPICGDYEVAPKVSPTDPLAMRLLRTWVKVANPVQALTDRDTGIAILAPDARRKNGQRFPPAPFTCPGAPPVVYVPWSLVEQVYGGNADYSEGLLAFMLAHELGHRLNDMTPDGCALAAFERPGQEENIESHADFRGAFFTAVAGFDTRALADADIVTRFLEAEFRLHNDQTGPRKTALVEALRYFDAYETLYQSGLALTLSGEVQTATRLLDWADELVQNQGVLVPEITVAHALALIAEATPNAPWLDRVAGLDAPGAALACRPVFPSHTALAEAPRPGPVRADRSRRAQARKALDHALRLLQRADDLGASRLATGTARACAQFLLGEPTEALRLQERAMKLALARRPAVPAVTEALMANQALFQFGQWLDEHPQTSVRAAREAVKPWLPTFALHPALGAWLRNEPRPATAGAPECKAQRSPPAPIARAPFVSAPTGTCPDGWVLAHVLPAPRALAATGSNTGLTICERDDRTLAHVFLPELTDPPKPEVNLTLVAYDRVPPALQALDTWACQCEALVPRGSSDVGETAWLASCPAILQGGGGAALIRADAKGRVTGMTVLPLP